MEQMLNMCDVMLRLAKRVELHESVTVPRLLPRSKI